MTQLRLIPAVFLLSFLVLSCGPPAQNDGRESGYYGDFNRVKNALVSVPDVRISDVMMNRDVTLEKFGFELTKSSGKVIWITFGERDPIRELSGKQLVQALQKRIAAAVP